MSPATETAQRRRPARTLSTLNCLATLLVTLLAPSGLIGPAAGVTATLALISSPTMAAEPKPREGSPPAEPPPPPIITRLPELLTFVEAAYPLEARNAGIEGSVLLQIDIDATGAVIGVEVLERAGHGFDEAAHMAAQKFVFSPAESGDQKIPVRIVYRYGFKLSTAPPPEAPAGEEAGETRVGEQTGAENLTGRVLEAGSRDPLEEVSLVVDGTGLRAETDAEGRFSFRGVPPGTAMLKASLPAYEGRTLPVEVAEGKRSEVTLYLTRRADRPYAMEVRTKREHEEVVQHSIAIEEVRRVPGTFGDAVRVIQNLPGVARSPFGLGFLIVRGTGPMDTGTYIDGMRVPILFHFGGLVSVFNSSLLDRVDYLPGGFSARYGRTIGGVVDLATRDTIPERIHGYAEVDLLNSSFFIQGSAGKLGYSLSARRSYIDFLANPLIERFQGVQIRFPRYWDTQLKFDYRSSPRDTFQLMLFASDDRFSVLGEASDGADEATQQEAEFGSYTTTVKAKGRWAHRFSDALTNRLDFSIGPEEQNVQFGAGEISFAPVNGFIRNEVDYILSPAARFRAGLDLQLSLYRFRLFIPGSDEVEGVGDFTYEEEALGISPSPYLEAEITLADQLKVIPGVRVDPLKVIDQYQQWSVDPRVAFRSQVGPGTVIKGSIGRYSQPPQPQQFFKEIGTPELRFEYAIQTGFGLEQRITPAIQLDAVVYFNSLHDLVRIGPGGGFASLFIDDEDDDDLPAYTNDGRGRNYGLEVLLRHDFTDRFFGWVSYTFSRAERWNPDLGAWDLFAFDQPHILTVVGSYRLPKRWEMSARFRFTSGLPFTPVVNAYQDLDDHSWVPIYGEIDSARNDPFHALDIRVQKDWIFERWKLQGYLDVQNIYNRQNPEASFYSFDFRNTEIIAGLPILPVLGIRGDF